MAFSIEREDNDIIKVVFNDEVDYLQRVEAVEALCKLINGNKTVKLLIDLTKQVSKMTLEEQEKFGIYLANAKGLMNAKVASVTAYDHSTNIVVEAVAFSNGYQIVNFNHVKDAKAWLKGELK